MHDASCPSKNYKKRQRAQLIVPLQNYKNKGQINPLSYRINLKINNLYFLSPGGRGLR